MSNRNAGWFRFYERMIDSPQILELSDSEFRLLVSLWCLASASEERGTVPFSARAIQRRVMPDHDVPSVCDMLATLTRLELIRPRGEGEPGDCTGQSITGYIIVNWDKHQYTHASWTPEARKQQKRNERAKMSQVSRNDVATSRNTDTDADEDADSEPDSPSGKSGNNPVDDVAAASPKVTPLRRDKRPSADEWQRTAQAIASRLKIGPAKVNDLLALFEQYPHPPNYFTIETGKCLEWCEDNKKRPNLRTFSNWLVRAEEHAQQAKQEAARRASQNGHTRTAANSTPNYTRSYEDALPK